MPLDRDRFLKVLKQQHTAMDELMAQLIAIDPTFRPTRSGEIWLAAKAGHELIQDMEANHV